MGGFASISRYLEVRLWLRVSSSAGDVETGPAGRVSAVQVRRAYYYCAQQKAVRARVLAHYR